MSTTQPRSKSVFTPSILFPLSILLRLALLFWGQYQDAHSPLKYTDIDYLVFTDASRALSRSSSPYIRDTYRYTPLLAWLLYPTTLPSFFSFGKVVFAAGDVVTGYLILRILVVHYGFDTSRAGKYAAIWLLNPMVANISTRGSSEGLLAVIVVALLWATLGGWDRLAGALLGLGVHFKIYPFVYAASIWWFVGGGEEGKGWIWRLLGWRRVMVALYAAIVFMGLNLVMFKMYGMPFVEQSYLYHLVRIDHRHNFSVYNTLLHLRSAIVPNTGIKFESLAFIPQLVLSVLVIPYCLAKKDLASTMLAQTFAFVTFNKVCTSQYFLWYMVFLPFYLPRSSFLARPILGITALVGWVVGQAAWLEQGYRLEFLGQSTFVPGLCMATLAFFCVNCWILDIIVSDIARGAPRKSLAVSGDKKTT